MVIYQYIKKNKLPHYISGKNILIISYDNKPYINADTGGATQNFINGLNYFGYDFVLLGKDQPWAGWVGRQKEYIQFINMISNKNIYIILSDARDVLVNNDYSNFELNLDKLYQLYDDKNKDKLLFSTEVGCCVGPMHIYPPGTILDNKNNKIKIAPMEKDLLMYPNILEKWFNVNKELFIIRYIL